MERLQADIVKRLTMPVYGLKGARGALAALDGKFSRNTFDAYVESRDLPKEFPGARGFGFIERVARRDLSAFVATRQREGGTEFRVHGTGQDPTLYVVTQISPFSHNFAAWGIDSGANPVRRQAIEQAIDSGEATLSAPVRLVQDPLKGTGFLMLVPVYQEGHDPGTPTARRAALLGLLYAPLVAADVLRGVAEPALSLLDLKLSVRTTTDEFQTLLAARQGEVLPPNEWAEYSLADAPTAQSLRFTVAGREFLIDAALSHDARHAPAGPVRRRPAGGRRAAEPAAGRDGLSARRRPGARRADGTRHDGRPGAAGHGGQPHDERRPHHRCRVPGRLGQ